MVGVIMGSKSDYEVMKDACDILDLLEIEYEVKVVSAHRTPNLLVSYAQEAAQRNIDLIIAGAGGAAHLPGMVASLTHLPVIGVPVKSRALSGIDSLLSIVQMPGGVPVGTMAINGAKNAGLYAASILAMHDEKVKKNLIAYREKQTKDVLEIEL